jgi:predicted transposase/invertase (TIGR01784 family)
MEDRVPRYINPYTDFGFKKLFGEEANKDLLIDFLNELLPAHHKIADLNFRNTEQLPDAPTDRRAIFDIHCTAQSGAHFIVEMQKAKLKFFKDRSLFYVTYPIRTQSHKGDWDFGLLPIYFVAILDFFYDEEEEKAKFRRDVSLKDQDCELFFDKLHFKFLQMPVFKKQEYELKTHFEKWIFFLKNLENFDDIPAILNEPVFQKAFHEAEIARFSPDERHAYEESLFDYVELRESLKTSKEEGLEQGRKEGLEEGRKKGLEEGRKEGLEEGRKEGLEEGRKEAILSVAKTMKNNNVPIDQIAGFTGLSNEQIEKL